MDAFVGTIDPFFGPNRRILGPRCFDRTGQIARRIARYPKVGGEPDEVTIAVSVTSCWYSDGFGLMVKVVVVGKDPSNTWATEPELRALNASPLNFAMSVSDLLILVVESAAMRS